MLLHSFLRHKGFISNGKACNAPLMPYLIADAIYLTYEQHIKGRVKQRSKQLANAMMQAYDHLNKDFFRSFDYSEHDDVVEMMDAFDEYMHNPLEMFRMAVQQPLMEMPSEERNIFSAIAVCRLLSAHAMYMWNTIYRTAFGTPMPNDYLRGMEYYAYELFRLYGKKHSPRQTENIDLNDYPIIRRSCDNVVNSISNFINGYVND